MRRASQTMMTMGEKYANSEPWMRSGTRCIARGYNGYNVTRQAPTTSKFGRGGLDHAAVIPVSVSARGGWPVRNVGMIVVLISLSMEGWGP